VYVTLTTGQSCIGWLDADGERGDALFEHG
jgi:hypothetical protein